MVLQRCVRLWIFPAFHQQEAMCKAVEAQVTEGTGAGRAYLREDVVPSR